MGETYGAHGHHFVIDSPEPVASRVRQALATLRVEGVEPVGAYRVTPGASDENSWYLTWQDGKVGLRVGIDHLLLLLHWHVNQQTIAASVRRRTTFHAAAARSPRGRGILLAAPMESGKTTTVTGLLRAGWDFLTDEAAAVDPDGTVWAYPKPLTIDRGSWPLFPDLDPGDTDPSALSWLVPASACGRSVVDGVPLGLLVLPAYIRGARTWAERLSPSQAALALAHSTFFFDQHGGRDLACIGGLARRTPAYRVEIGNLAEAVEVLDGLDLALGAAA